MTAAVESEYLFGSVPAGLFRIFSGRSRRFFADLLTNLADDLFGQAGEIATRRRVQDAIAEYVDRMGRAQIASDLSEENSDGAAGPTHLTAYDRLVATGWLVEYRDRYRKVVDFDPAARLLLQTLLDIRDGRVRSYGGAVLNVLTLLQSVADDPSTKALNVREAAQTSRTFMNHLRTVASTMRRVEQLMLAQPTTAAVVRTFVADFISATVVQDYRNLHAKESPYRFRGNIITVGEDLLEDDAKLLLIVDGWIKGGIANDVVAAREGVIADLRQTLRVFGLIDEHVNDIEQTVYRIERRMTNVVRFSERMATVTTDRLLAALTVLGAADVTSDAEVSVHPRLVLETLPLAAVQMYVPARRRSTPAERVVEVRKPDPALLLYLAAMDAFDRRVAVTPERLADYVERELGEADAKSAKEFTVETLDDFLLFERLHEAGLAPLNDSYAYEAREDRVANPWVERADFVVKRTMIRG